MFFLSVETIKTLSRLFKFFICLETASTTLIIPLMFVKILSLGDSSHVSTCLSAEAIIIVVGLWRNRVSSILE